MNPGRRRLKTQLRTTLSSGDDVSRRNPEKPALSLAEGRTLSGVEGVALLGHESSATTQIYTHAGQKRLSKLVEGL